MWCASLAFVVSCLSAPVFGASIDWQKITRLQDSAFLDYVVSLNLKGQEAIDFWKKIPLSKANRQVNRLFRREAFGIFMNKYPRARKQDSDQGFQVGKGTVIKGPIDGQILKLPFSSYYPLAEGTVGDPKKTYRVGYSIHGLSHPWLKSNAESAMWEVGRHSNVELVVVDGEFDTDKQVGQIEQWIREEMDGLLVWPMQEAPLGPPIVQSTRAGIPVVTVDRMAGTRRVSTQVTGNFPANGAQQGVYLIHRLLQETGEVAGNVLMIRKPLGSTADSMRTGHFLKVISYFPGIQILESQHNSSNREASRIQVLDALGRFQDIDVVFCTGAEQAMGAVAAIDEARRWNSRQGGRSVIVLSNDDLYESLEAMQQDKIAVIAPYTPLLGGLGLRILLKVLMGEEVPRNVTTPDLPMITKEKQTIFGIQTMGIDEWLPYAYGKKQPGLAQ
ncbi:MAG: sugar ABC transporter substrate-binding protein [Gammaproteobacteria bacterium]|nr:sugar ABC transporter substrate-binding protein [Gammaproteobacteria bacterium]